MIKKMEQVNWYITDDQEIAFDTVVYDDEYGAALLSSKGVSTATLLGDKRKRFMDEYRDYLAGQSSKS